MAYENNYISEEMKSSDIDMGEQIEDLDQNMGKKKKRAIKKDRKNSKYSEEDFMKLPRTEQKELVEKYWMGKTSDFDDGMFQFSYTHFTKLCQKLGFRKGIIDISENENLLDMEIENSESILYIDHGKRENTEIKKLTLAKDTIDKIDQLLGNKLSNVERSKVIDLLLSQTLDQKLADKKAGKFGVAYRPVEEKRII